ncbi:MULTISPECIES: hypothetical protein [Peribacillus]|uniref:hypothetical protein n=1 Tax=Peribacillus TaxID=2675229 RepID=UPI000BA71D8A|nr:MULTISPECIES: hypothetical protein [Peribacillus]MBD8591642.1 hypothetical protein [Peribacillus simplex]MCM3170368.1 hypothetical protein [Peribacillus frigoritolerans]MEE3955800.1 hypothetical protein [Peribacillus frigoritolerans]PAL14727.1 hypothetical protein B8W99_04695 [Peribacillus simplex]
MTERKMCLYCAQWYHFSVMTPLYEQGKTYIAYYCERCTPAVKDNLMKLPYRSLFTWGNKGSDHRGELNE